MYCKAIFSFLILPICLLIACQSPDEPETHSSQVNTANKPLGIFITVEDYLKLHPKQKLVSEEFSRIVQNPGQPIPPGQQDKPVTIAFIYPGQQASDYWRRSVTSFVARMHELGIKFELKEFFSKGGGLEVRKQEQQLKEALDQDPDYLVFTFDVNRHQKLIERILAQGMGYSVDSVSSGELALEFIQKNPVDLIMIDMLMDPGMNGRQTYEEIIKLYPDQKGIIASGFSESDDVKATLELGVGGFMKKPYSMAQLGRMVREVLHD